MNGLRVRIHHPDGRSEELTVEVEQLCIGSGAHCEIRLPTDQAAFEHVVIRAVPAGIYAEARSFDPPPTLNSVEFSEAPVLAGTVLGIGPVKLEIEQVGVSSEAAAEATSERRSNPRLYLYALIGVLGAGAIWLSKPKSRATMAEPEQVPALFSMEGVPCSQSAAEQARALAETKLAQARGKRERSPFHAQDGVAAVPLYQMAAACFRAAGADDRAAEANAESAELRDRVAEDFRAERVRLQRAIATSDWTTAQRAVRALMAYTEGMKNDYVDWLASAERRIALVHGGKKR